MGGDHAPGAVVAGAADAVRESGGRLTVALVGQQERIERELKALGIPGSGMTVVHAAEVIEMHDAPTAALKAKKGSSISIGLGMHREGRAQGFVSAGNTGAVLSASTLILGRLEGVGRPTIGALVPTAGSPAFLVDAGANVDCRPRHLFEFGVMGSIYVTTMLAIPSPRVGLLSIGEEETKGNEVTLEAHALLKSSTLNFIGNVEGRDILKGTADVVVCDGFVGNIVLKFGESVPAFLKARFTSYAAGNLSRKVVGLIARSGLRTVMKELDYQEYGGVPVLGVRGVSIIGHGGSSPKAIKNMILRAEEMIHRQVNGKIQEALKA